ncbi:MAG: phosphatidylglycerophosphatase A [Planctomycetota bacterium]|nr:MAG: phosphatidylglycerophosphatase A [Planctomycetota bacterium]
MSFMRNRRHLAAYVIATGLGAGWCPWAPGTIGSLWGLPLGWALLRPGSVAVFFLAWCAAVALGLWSSHRVATDEGSHDPQHVVIDEIAAFPLVYLPLCLAGAGWSWRAGLAGFVLFRLFDILKPWPIRRLERLPGGWGIMVDDQVAALYAAATLWAFVALRLL